METKEKKAVALVMVPAWTNINRPGVGNYEHPMVMKVIPCWKVGDKYYDLRSNVKVEKKDSYKLAVLEWPILTGTVFEYQDHSRFLLTRNYTDNQFKVIPLEPRGFHPETMILHKLRG